MHISDAVDLIREAAKDQTKASLWADLGCGSGTFTLALAQLLAEGSTIHAIDLDRQSLPSVAGSNVRIRFRQADFEKDALALPSLDGMMMANALHYVADKKGLLSRLPPYIKRGGGLLLVEYDTLRAKPWVLYPIDFPHMQGLLQSLGMEQIMKDLTIESNNPKTGATSRARAYFLLISFYTFAGEFF